MEYAVNDMDKYNRFLGKLRSNGWSLWQMQYRWDDPEGFHAWFWKSGEEQIEIITSNEAVEKAIVEFNP